MRPIDGETLRNTLEAWIERMNQRANATQYHTELATLNAKIEVIESAIDEIERMPKVDVEPVRHGHCYVDSVGYERCSVCNESEHNMRYFRFCPHCGARMEGE